MGPDGCTGWAPRYVSGTRVSPGARVPGSHSAPEASALLVGRLRAQEGTSLMLL